MNKRLLIDIGNSNIKIASASSLNILNITIIPYSSNSLESKIQSAISEFKKYDFKYIAVSMPFHINTENIYELITEYFGIRPLIINLKLKSPLIFEYEKSIGTDRICSALGAYVEYNHKNILVVDFGTATTYNLISYGNFKGGLICPGIMTSLNSLSENTKLTSSILKFPADIINKNTKNNINGGVLYTSLFTFERIAKEVKKEYDDLLIVLTGGFADFISRKTKIKHITDKNILFKGMNYFISNNLK